MLEDSVAPPEDPGPESGPTPADLTPVTARGVAIAPCPEPDQAEALEVLYRRLPSAMRPGTIAALLRQVEAGQLDLSGLWVARRRGRIAGAMLTQVLAGRAAAIWPPEVERGWGSGTLASDLVRSALDSYRARGIRLAQALVDRQALGRPGVDLARGGLPYVTDLIYLGRPTAGPQPVPPGVPELRWEDFGPENREEFARTLERTYGGSLDMPELGGLRTLDDVLEGHRARGHFDPARWRLGRLERGAGPGADPGPVAVLMLSAGEPRTWEVSYLGLVPEARGRGLGVATLAHALDRARPDADRIELAVDVRNAPAEALYRRCGFTPFERRGVHLAILDDSDGAPG
ncbi:GNAT family N-acetyltransferase [Tautonia plasticadhaerens]|uniref:Mycothiol acetyltransferase n=1 Tax=Tautonia plasticadhaerens TaxID=2527974 RepID=A0A518HDZ4_9BACT|nr:GNAT family N-acetyltransferase [Tautonia plasticadhaerens]QDV39060.1 Mycothiol acetyltransferase [Tautonia plasticadhaerens]